MLALPDSCSKFTALQEIFYEEEVYSNWPNRTISADTFLKVISKPVYNLREELHLKDATIRKIVDVLWPDKPKTSIKLCGFILQKYGYKYCINCCFVKQLNNWHNNSSKAGGKDSYCKPCFNEIVRDHRKEYEARHRAEKLNRTPKWADLVKIKEFYDSCPDGYQVDHVIPLLGELVSGFHVENNLQYLTISDNLKKSNKYIPE